ncbi:CRISPR-associated protein [Marinobacterium aestuarii]|uniref:CRISPR-associated protein n=2 Tax=Marinobacterium aestuarii TaxID=1821621 RepID=A0A1A9EX48_9GAMM|nr:CRISPR-associated protein [Marinobacterium aestuarii]
MLLAVSGMSPAIITETLFSINRKGSAWPQALKIITTSKGAERLWQGLVLDGHLDRLCAVLDNPRIPFSRDDILVVPGKDGEPVVDARSVEDHEALANFIVTTVRDYTRDENTGIHASIAGGRKTMTFYLGYAMSLFGRRIDSLSHVLVSEGYENHPDFFYPTRESHPIRLRDGTTLDARDAEVTLADIPFIRQRRLVPELLKEFSEQVNFRELVNLINLGDEPQALRLDIYPREYRLRVYSSHSEVAKDIHISNLWHWVLYLLLAAETLQASDRGGYARPGRSEPDSVLAIQMAMTLAELRGIQCLGSSVEELIDELLQNDSLWEQHSNLERSLQAVRNKGGVTDTQFSTYLNSIQQELTKHLPTNLVQCLMPAQMFDENGEALLVTGKIKNKGCGYGIPLPNPHKQIRILVD